MISFIFKYQFIYYFIQSLIELVTSEKNTAIKGFPKAVVILKEYKLILMETIIKSKKAGLKKRIKTETFLSFG